VQAVVCLLLGAKNGRAIGNRYAIAQNGAPEPEKAALNLLINGAP